jgi:hypothetical protein
MNRIFACFFAVLVLGSCLSAQTNQAAMSTRPHQVKQGEVVRIDVNVSPVPNISGAVAVFVAPEGSTVLNVGGNRAVTSGQASVSGLEITIPTDAQLGNWKVVKVLFQPQSSPQHDLAISGSTTFEVVKRETVVPTSANVDVR